MKKQILILLIFLFSTTSILAKNSFCDFTLTLGEGIEMNQSYKMASFIIKGIKIRNHAKLIKKIKFEDENNIQIDLIYFQKAIADICRYKKYEIVEINIDFDKVVANNTISILFNYQLIQKIAKSKG